MFERRTVFVVGAGGSKELGLPMGSELTKSIAGRVRFSFPNGWTPKGGDEEIYHSIRLATRERGERNSNPFYLAGEAIARGMPQGISIDNFLHTHSDDEYIKFMGKLGITSAILEAERNSKIKCGIDPDELLEFDRIEESWHTVFFKMLLEGASRSEPSAIFGNVAIITFNYDRCIERYLLHSLQSYLGMNRAEAEALLERLEVIHPYGQVGKLNEIAFGKQLHHSMLHSASTQIKTFTERVDDDATLDRMHRLLAEAEVVVYLGFSYGDMNMKLMSLEQSGERVVYGTSLGLSSPNQNVIERDIINSMGPDDSAVKHIELTALTCRDFLYAYWKPIVRGI